MKNSTLLFKKVWLACTLFCCLSCFTFVNAQSCGANTTRTIPNTGFSSNTPNSGSNTSCNCEMGGSPSGECRLVTLELDNLSNGECIIANPQGSSSNVSVYDPSDCSLLGTANDGNLYLSPDITQVFICLANGSSNDMRYSFGFSTDNQCPAVACAIDILNVDVTDESCPDANDGQAVISSNCVGCDGGANPGRDYTIFEQGTMNVVATQTNVGGDATFMNLPPGDYTVEVVDGGGTVNVCSDTEDFSIAAATAPTLSVTDISGAQICDGSDVMPNAMISGSTGTITYDWQAPVGSMSAIDDNTSASPTITLDGGSVAQINIIETWTLVIMDSGTGCTVSTTFDITISSSPLETITSVIHTDATCAAIDDGSITVNFVPQDGRTNIEFSIDGGATWEDNLVTDGSYTFDDLAEGTYQLLVKWGNDDCEFQRPGSINLNNPEVTIENVFITHESCDGEEDGQIIIAGIVPDGDPIQYRIPELSGALNNWRTDNTYPDLAPGTYTVQVRNNRNVDTRVCTASGQVVVYPGISQDDPTPIDADFACNIGGTRLRATCAPCSDFTLFEDDFDPQPYPGYDNDGVVIAQCVTGIDNVIVFNDDDDILQLPGTYDLSNTDAEYFFMFDFFNVTGCPGGGQGSGGDDINFEISTNAGASWQNLYTHNVSDGTGAGQMSPAIPGDAGRTDVLIRVRSNLSISASDNVQLDNLKIFGSPAGTATKAWYNVASGGTPIATSNNFNPNNDEGEVVQAGSNGGTVGAIEPFDVNNEGAIYRFYVECVCAGCPSTRVAIDATVNECCDINFQDVFVDNESCAGEEDGAVTINASVPGNAFNINYEIVGPGGSMGPQLNDGDFSNLPSGDYAINLTREDDASCMVTGSFTVGAGLDIQTPNAMSPFNMDCEGTVPELSAMCGDAEAITVFEDDFGDTPGGAQTGWDFERGNMLNDCRDDVFGPPAGNGLYFDNNDDVAQLPGSYDLDFDKYDYFVSFDYWNNGFQGCRDNAASVSENADNLILQSSVDGVTWTNQYNQPLADDGSAVDEAFTNAPASGTATYLLRVTLTSNINNADDAFLDNLIITAQPKAAYDIAWYDMATGGTEIATGSPYTPSEGDAGFSSSSEGTYSFYAQCSCGACSSTRTQVDIIVGTCCQPSAGILVEPDASTCLSFCYDEAGASIDANVFGRTQPASPANYEYDLAIVSQSTGLITEVIAIAGSPANTDPLSIAPSTDVVGTFSIHPVNWLGTETLTVPLAAGQNFSNFSAQFDYNNGDINAGPGSICGDVQVADALSFVVLDTIAVTAQAVCTTDGVTPSDPNQFYVEVSDIIGGQEDYTVTVDGNDYTFDGTTLYIGPFFYISSPISLEITDENMDVNALCTTCEGSTTVTIETPSVLLIAQQAEICPGSELLVDATIGANGPYSLSFTSSTGTITRDNVNDGDVLSFIEGVDFDGADAVDLTLDLMTDANGCNRTSTIQITVDLYDGPSVEINTPAFSEVCLGQSLLLSAEGTDGTPDYSYDWMVVGGSGTASLVADEDTVRVIGTAMGTVDVAVTLTDDNGCTASDTITVTITEECPGFRVADPCACNDDASVDGDNGTFAETVSISGASPLPSGQSWQIVSIVGGYVDNGATEGPGAELDAADIILFTHNAADSTYDYSFAHVDAQGYTVSVQGPNPDTDGDPTTIEPGNDVFEISNTCFYPNPVLVSATTVCEDAPAFSIEVQNVDTTGSNQAWAYDADNDPSTDNATASGSVDWLSDDGEVNPQDPSFPSGAITIEYEFDADDAPGTSSPGCTKTVSLSLITQPNLVVNGVVTDETCDENNGAIDITVTGGDDSYIYNWSNGETTEDLTDLSSGFYTVVVSDTTACSATATYQVLDIEDTEGPTLNCPGPITRVNTPGECFYLLVGPVANATVTGDNCSDNADITLTHDFVTAPMTTTLVGAEFPIGTTVVTWTATDEAGNTSTCTVSVTVSDSEVPVLTCTDVNRNIDSGMCTYTFTGPGGDVVVSDNCTFISTHNYPGAPSTNTLAGATFPVGTTPVFWVVVDEGGNEVTCTRNIVITDNVDPMLVCADAQTLPTDTAQCTVRLEDSADPLMAGDNCEYTLTHNYVDAPLDTTLRGAVLPVGETTVTWTITDLSGNSLSCDVVITVEDQENPQFVNCPADTLTVGNDIDNCESGVIWSIPVANDNCSVDTVEQIVGPAPGSSLPVGNTEIQYVARDAAGNTDTCTFYIRVEDTQQPLLSCIGDLVRDMDEGMCTWTSAEGQLDPALVSENCAANLQHTVTLAGGPMMSDTGAVMSMAFPLGESEICYFLSDSSGAQIDSCCFTVRVVDNENPMIECPEDVVVDNDEGFCGAVVEYGEPVLTDNCPLPMVVSDTFMFTGGMQMYTVPADVDLVSIQVFGAQGGNGVFQFFGPPTTIPGGAGGFASGNLAVTPGDVLNVYVGQMGSTQGAPGSFGGAGFNGGGDGAGAFLGGRGGGGGASDVRIGGTALTDRILVAGGGGGSCQSGIFAGGTGGGLTGTDGSGVLNGSGGGTAAGGSGLGGCDDGAEGIGGSAAGLCFTAGGGGGWYGGGTGCGAGGGSSYIAGSLLGSTTAGGRLGDGMVIISYNPPLTLQAGLPSGSLFPVGETVNVYQVTDAAGNTTTCSFTVTVNDAEAPMIACPTDTMIVSSAGGEGDCAGILEWSHPLPQENCSLEEYVVRYTNPDGTEDGPFAVDLGLSVIGDSTATRSFKIGDTEVEYFVTDPAGNSATCSFIVTVTDDEDPEFVNCPTDTITVGNDVDNCGGGANWAIPVASDNCALDTVERVTGPAPGSVLPTGVTEIQYVARDENGNTDTCTFYINVVDTQDPLVVCPVDATFENDPGMCSWTSADGQLNPVIARENCAADLQHRITFESGGITNDTGFVASTLFPLGAHEVCYFLSDSSGTQTDSCCFMVTVIDTEAPIIECPNNISRVTDPDECSYTFTGPAANVQSVMDNCSDEADITIINDFNNSTSLIGAEFPEGVTVVTWTATDEAGNSATCSFTITVTDNQTPVLDCSPVNRVIDSGECTYTFTGPGGDPVVDENCPFTITHNYDGAPSTSTLAGAVFPIGTTTVYWVVVDAAGTEVTCNKDIIVTDNVDPTIACANDLDVSMDAGQCNYTVTDDSADPTVVENCDFTLTHNYGTAPSDTTLEGASFPRGTTVVTWTVEDLSGNSASCDISITVSDNEDPIFVNCATDTLTIITDIDTCGAFANWSIPVATDNCDTVTVVQTMGDPSGSFFDLGSTIIEYTATDASGGTETCSFVITVIDNQDPTVIPKDTTLYLDASGMATLNTADVDGGSYDNCGIANLEIFENDPSTLIDDETVAGLRPPFIVYGCDDIGFNNVFLVVTDNSGNTSLAVAEVLVLDTIAPEFTCPEDQNVEGCNGIVPDLITGLTATDNCNDDLVSFTQNPVPGVAFGNEAGDTINVIITAIDSSGNETSCDVTLTILDTEGPLFVNCPMDTLTVGNDVDNCEGGVIWSVPIAEDDCGVDTVRQTMGPAPGSSLPVGVTQIQYVAEDGSGNTDTCTFFIEVVDTQLPLLVCQDDITVDNDEGECSWTSSMGELNPLSVNENCEANLQHRVTLAGGPMMPMDTGVVMPMAFPVGESEVCYFLSDSSGVQIDSCCFIVTVEDNENPMIECPEDVVVDNDEGFCGAVVEYDEPVLTDNCPLPMVVSDTFMFTGGMQMYTVPADVDLVSIQVFGAQGGNGVFQFFGPPTTIPGGAGGFASGNLAVTPGDVLNVYVGQMGSTQGAPGSFGGAGFNGGGDGAGAFLGGRGGGGGASDVRFGGTALTDRILVAGGGGGSCQSGIFAGGTGGGLTGTDGSGVLNGSGGGTAAGGSGLGGCDDGAEGIGGSAAGLCFTAGGGGGWYGGGTGCGAGGGSSYIAGSLLGSTTAGGRLGDGMVIISYNPPLTLQAGLPSGSLFPVGETVNVYQVTDAAGNTTTCSFTVTVNDAEAPMIACPTDTMIVSSAGGEGDCAGILEWSHPLPQENCSLEEYVVRYTNPDGTEDGPFAVDLGLSVIGDSTATRSFEIGDTEVEYFVTDPAGNSATCSFIVTVTDDEDPEFVNCPTDTITVGNDVDNCDGGANWAIPVATDNCGVDTVEQITGPAPGSVLPVGMTDIVYVARDTSGNTDTCAFVIEVIDSQTPLLACPADVTFENDEGECSWTSAMDQLNPVIARENCEANLQHRIVFADGTATVNDTGYVMSTTFPLGDNEIGYFLSDSSGSQIDSCFFTLTVLDTEAPMMECPEDVTVDNDMDVCTASLPIVVEPSDNCAVDTVLVSVQNPDGSRTDGDISMDYVFEKGRSEVSLTVSDTSGNTSTCMYQVVVEDAQLPTIECPTGVGPLDALIRQATTECSYTFVGTAADPTYSDNCPDSTITHNYATAPSRNTLRGAEFPVGVTRVVWTVTDCGGNTATCVVRVDVRDNVAPEFVNCPMDTITVGNDVDNCDGGANWAIPVATDNCGVDTVEQITGPAPGSVLPVGITDIVYVARDTSGNTDTCAFVIEVIDTQTPLLACPADVTFENDEGECSWTSAMDQLNPVIARENCEANLQHRIVFADGSPTVNDTGYVMPTTFPLGDNEIGYFLSDSSGAQIDSCFFTLTVEDTEAPMLTCPGDMTVDNDSDECSTSLLLGGGVLAVDNCALDTILASVQNPDGSRTMADITMDYVFEKGRSEVTITAIDSSGNEANCMFQVVVEDAQLPTIECPTAGLDRSADLGECSFTMPGTGFDPIYMDNCPDSTVMHDYVFAPSSNTLAGASFPVGSTVVTWTVTDCGGNTATCMITITVTDNEAPQFVNCPSDTITVGNDVDNCDGGANWAIPVATDNCGVDTVEQITGPAPGSVLPVGITDIVYVARDTSGNTDTCAFVIEVIDTQTPLLACPADVTFENDEGECSWTSAMDQLNPVIARENCEANLQYRIVFADGTATVNDTGYIMSTTFPLGDNEIGYFLSDSSGAQIDSCFFTLTVEDTEVPMLTCPGDMTVDNDTDECSTSLLLGGGVLAVDNCALDTILASVQNPDGSRTMADITMDYVFEKGRSEVTITAIDSSGNEANCMFQVVVEDAQLPTIECPTAGLDRSADLGECSFTMPGTGFDPIYMDNCPDSTVMHDYVFAPNSNTLAGASFPVGSTVVTWTVTDCGGNTATCMITIVVTDDEAPQITNCPASGQIIQDTDDGLCEATVNFSNITGIDNCNSLDSLTIEYMLSGGLTQDWTEGQASGLSFPLDTTTVSYRITDTSGNVSDTCEFDVIVIDNQAPDAICRDIEVFLDENGMATIVVDSIDGGSYDNCGIESLLPMGDLMYGCDDLGFNELTLVAIDSSGNTDSCVAVITVRDTIAPDFECPVDMTVGGCSGTVPDLITGLTGTDNCDDVVFTQTPRPGVTFGPNADDTVGVKIIATDGSGNMSMCIVTLTIIDNEDPYFQNCPDSLVYNNDVDECGAIVSWLAPIAFDNCDDSLDVVQIAGGLPGSFFPVGVDTITYEAFDDDGNRIECTFPVIVLDSQAPTAVCKDIDVVVGGDCEVTILPGDVDAGSFDNCGLVEDSTQISMDGITFMDSIVLTQADLDPSQTTIWLRVVDSVGNASVCTADIEVFDVDDPMVVCQDDITIYTEPDVCYGIVPNVLPPFDTSDNCLEIPEINQVPQPGVIWGSKPGDSLEIFVEVIDTDGNRDTCSLFAVLVDTMRPHFINCPRPTINVKTLPDWCGAFVNFSLPVAEDNCDDLVIRKLDDTGLTTGDMFPVGATVLSWIAEDASGNLSDTCRIKIIVNDAEAPTIECPEDLTVGTDAGACEATVRGIGPVIEDQCPDNVLTTFSIVNTESGDQIAAGFEDASGELFGCGENVVTYRTQDHPLVLITEVSQELESAVGGTNPVPGFITANTTSGDDYVEVTNFGPNAIELNCLVLYRTSVSGVDSIMVPYDQELASGAVAVFHFGGGTNDDSNNFYVDSTATDLGSGDQSSYELRFEGGVIDAVALNGGSATNFSGNIASTSGTAGIIREFIWDTDSAEDWYVAEGCREQSIGSYNPDYPAAVDNGSSPAVGLQSFTNEGSECSFTVTVEDTELPMCGMLELNSYAGSTGSITAGCNEFTVTVGDAFEIGRVIIPVLDITHPAMGELSASLESPSGTEVEVSLMVPDTLIDFNGEMSSGDWILRISDEAVANDGSLDAWTLELYERQAYNRPDTIVDNDPGLCSAEVTFNAPELIDNCDVGNVIVSYTTMDDIDVPDGGEVEPGAPITEVFGVGTTDVLFTLFDKAGNSSTCGFSITVEDVEPPVVTCPDDITIDLEGGECDAIVNFLPETAEDNCSIDTIYSFPPSGSVFSVGTTEVILIVEDPAGNSDTCTFNVIVNEYIPEDNSLNCVGILNVSLDENCEACIGADELLIGEDVKCYEDYCIVITDSDGNVLPDTCIGLDQVGDTLSVSVTDCGGTGVSCWGYIYVEDKLVPEIECPDDITVACNEATDTTVTGSALLRSCEDSVTIEYFDEETHNGDCGVPRVLIERTWVITDESGNSNSCVQLITVDNANLDEVGFPEDVEFADAISCADVAANPARTEPVYTGAPTIKDKSVYEDNEYCEFNVGYWDEIVPDLQCGSSYAILRNWIVLNKCLPAEPGVNPLRHIQTIHVADHTPPTIECNDDLTIAVDAHNCFTLFNAMDYAPDASDDCSDIESVEVKGARVTQVLPLGDHQFTYVVRDECGNKAECTINVSVVDRTVPVVICETFRQVALLPDGLAKVEAESFDDGSYDNCNPVWFKARRMEQGECSQVNGDDSTRPGYQEWFDDYVKFCCDDINNDDLLVVLRVYDVDPGAGPVSPDAFEGHWNECMVRVDVQDKLPPVIVCPADVTISCSDDYELDNLSEYGDPFVTDACDVTWEERVIAPNDCGSGQRVIRRIFTATDEQGLTSQCIQNIYLVDPTPFTICDTESRLAPLSGNCANNTTGHTRRDGVEWPADVELSTCMGGLSPEDLKANPSVDNRDAMPTIVGGACAQIAMDYDDESFAIVDDACEKIIRTWTIIDWCQFDAVTRDPEDADRFLGYWQYIQIIKLKNTIGPAIENCEDLAICDDAAAGCDAQLDFTLEVSDDCTDSLEIEVTWRLDADNDGVYDISGEGARINRRVPLGVHRIQWRVEDGCDNFELCEQIITATDCKLPTPYCDNGIATVVMPSTGSIEVWARDLDEGSFDNCTEQEDLEFLIQKLDENGDPVGPKAGAITLTCEDIPNGVAQTIDVRVYVIDEAGNEDYCVTYILLQDTPDADNPEGVCDDEIEVPLVGGDIETETGRNASLHSVRMIDTEGKEVEMVSFTDMGGEYVFGMMDEGYSVLPYKNDDAANGLSTLDLIAIQRHILGVQRLDSPYKMVAADVDHNEQINVLDLLDLQEVILGLRDEFRNNLSWRYSEVENAPTMNAPYSIVEEVSLADKTASQLLDIDFTAIKIGDVNGDVNPVGLTTGRTIEKRGSGLELEVSPEEVKKDATQGTIRVPVRASNFKDLLGYQFSLEYSENWSYVEIESGALEIASDQVHESSRTSLVTNWYTAQAESFTSDEVLFTLVFVGEKTSEVKELSILDAHITAESYVSVSASNAEEVQIQGVELRVGEKTATEAVFVLHQNDPNPWKDQTVIRYELPEEMGVTIRVVNAEGVELHRAEQSGLVGMNEYVLRGSDLGNYSGVLYYRVETENYQGSKKMIRVE